MKLGGLLGACVNASSGCLWTGRHGLPEGASPRGGMCRLLQSLQQCLVHPEVLPCRQPSAWRAWSALASSPSRQPTSSAPCWLCTGLPASGLPRPHNNLAILPERMEGACSVHFSRTEGQLWVWPQDSCVAGRPQSRTSSISHSSEPLAKAAPGFPARRAMIRKMLLRLIHQSPPLELTDLQAAGSALDNSM
ncbi:unnamed protein product [Natator depressus]